MENNNVLKLALFLFLFITEKKSICLLVQEQELN